MSGTPSEGGDPACWAHLFGDDGSAETDRPSAVATGSPSPAPDDDQDDD